MERQVINGTRYINGVQLVPDVSFSLPFEDTFDGDAMVKWFQQRWTDSILWCAGYLLAIYVGQVNGLNCFIN